MNSGQKPERQLLFSGIAGVCALIGALLLRYILAGVGEGEALAGYSRFSVGLSFLVALELTGLVTGQIGLIRGEKPAALPVLALLLNGVIFVSAFLFIPR